MTFLFRAHAAEIFALYEARGYYTVIEPLSYKGWNQGSGANMTKKKIRERLGDFWRRLDVKWHEIMTAIIGALIFIAAFLAWWFGDRNLKWAVDIAAPTCLAWGALSIILLWVQLRSASRQEKDEAVWKRVEYLHEHFQDVPRLAVTEAVRGYLCELGIRSPPAAHNPITREQAEAIKNDKGTEARPPAEVLLTRYLNDWEDFCGAISVGVIDEGYAYEMEGNRLIHAFFGYREVINIFRETDGDDGKVRSRATGTPSFANKLYLELQRIALRWQKKRTEELSVQEERIVDANREADRLRSEALASAGVLPRARVELEGSLFDRH